MYLVSRSNIRHDYDNYAYPSGQVDHTESPPLVSTNSPIQQLTSEGLFSCQSPSINTK
jgi:hypothetical protein